MHSRGFNAFKRRFEFPARQAERPTAAIRTPRRANGNNPQNLHRKLLKLNKPEVLRILQNLGFYHLFFRLFKKVRSDKTIPNAEIRTIRRNHVPSDIQMRTYHQMNEVF